MGWEPRLGFAMHARTLTASGFVLPTGQAAFVKCEYFEIRKNIKIKHTNPYPSCSSQEFSVCVKCQEPAVGFCPRQPAGCQCCVVSVQYLTITKPTINKPTSPVCEAPQMMRFRCLTILNGCHQALSSLASLQLPETINALQEKDTPLLMCHMRRW